MKRILLSAGALALFSMRGSPAQAQAPVPPNATDTSQPTANVSENSTLTEIVVTAQRRGENLQKVPIAVTAFTAQTLKNSGLTGTTALEIGTPGLNITRQSTNIVPYLRGVGTSSTAAGVESPVAVYVDGVYYATSAGTSLPFNNIERIEVLKGPQGTLFGRNATGGLINIVTRDPSTHTALEGSVGYGNYNTSEGSLYATTGGGNLAADIALYGKYQKDGFGRNLNTGRDVNRERIGAIRSKILWRPSDRDRIMFSADFLKDRTDFGLNYNAVPGSLMLDGRSLLGSTQDTRGSFPSGNNNKSWGASLRYEHRFDWGTVSSLTAYRNLNTTYASDLTNSTLPLIGYSEHEKDQTFQQEILAVGEINRLKFTTGLFFFSANQGNRPLSIRGFAAPQVNYDQLTRQDTRSYAGFGQGTYAVTDSTNVTAGLRYTIDERNFVGQQIEAAGNITPGQTDILQIDKRTFKKLTWRFAVDQKLGPDALVYASYNRGFKSGVFNSTNIGQDPVNPETLDAYEIGAKTELLDRTVRVNLAAFRYNYKNIQLSAVDSRALLSLINAASAELKGAEAEIVFAPRIASGRLQLSASATYLHGRYKNFLNGPVTTPTGVGGNISSTADLSGNTTAHTPKFTTTLSADYRVPVGVNEIGLNVTFYHSDKFFWESDNRLVQPGYDILNSQLSFAFGRSQAYRVRLWGKNLTNAKYATFTFSSALADLSSAAPPRTYGVALDFKF